MADGRSKYNKMVKLLKPLIGQKIHLSKLERRIMIEIGTNDVATTTRMMIDLGLIIERDHMIFEIVGEADI